MASVHTRRVHHVTTRRNLSHGGVSVSDAASHVAACVWLRPVSPTRITSEWVNALARGSEWAHVWSVSNGNAPHECASSATGVSQNALSSCAHAGRRLTPGRASTSTDLDTSWINRSTTALTFP